MPTEPFHRLFFAVRPPVGVIPEIATLRDGFGQTRNLVVDEQLHLTTWLFHDSQIFPAEVAERAQAAVETVPLQPFHVVLDRMVGSKSHVLLLPSEPLQGFVTFQARLDHALRAKGLFPRAERRFNPHLTLLHGQHEVDASIDPISWNVEDLFMIDSIVGERRHEIVARWGLA